MSGYGPVDSSISTFEHEYMRQVFIEYTHFSYDEPLNRSDEIAQAITNITI